MAEPTDIGSKDIYYLSPDDDLQSVIACFAKNKISHIPVVQNNKLIAMVSKTDLVTFLDTAIHQHAGDTFMDLLERTRVKKLMVQPVLTATVNDTTASILEKLASSDASSIVLKEDQRIFGIVTEKDMVKYLAGQQGENVPLSEQMGLQMAEWLHRNGLIQLSKMLSDIGI